MTKPFSKKFKKGLKTFAATSAAVLLSMTLGQADPSITTQLNGRTLYFDQAPVMQQGRVLVPLRGIFENLGADVLYTPATKTIKATADGQTVELTLGQRQAFINGRQLYLDVPADTIGGRTMVPLRFVSEAMGADVKWQSATRTVAISRDAISPSSPAAQTPDPQPQAPIANLSIGQLIHNARGTLGEGDTLTVTLTGAPGAEATFAILGSISDIRMTEVAPGRYEGRLRVTRGLDVNQGTLIAYLRKDGKEVVREADRAVTIATTTNLPVTNSQVANLTPHPGTTITNTRPLLRAQFPEQIRPGTATITLNGQNFTPSLSQNSQTLTMTPSYALNSGTHTVEAQALSQQGRLMKESWTFEVRDPNTVGVQSPRVSLTNLSNGSSVPSVFNIQGQTSPYTKVRIDTSAERPLIPGIIGLKGQTFQTSTVSDALGRFNVQLDTSNVPKNSRIDLEVSVLDSNGVVADSVDIDLVRR